MGKLKYKSRLYIAQARRDEPSLNENLAVDSLDQTPYWLKPFKSIAIVSFTAQPFPPQKALPIPYFAQHKTATPYFTLLDGHPHASAHSPQRGRCALHTCRPCCIKYI